MENHITNGIAPCGIWFPNTAHLCPSSFVAVMFMAFLFFFVFIYLFWLSCVLVAAWGIFIVACGLLSCGMWTLSCGMWTVSCSMHVGSSSPTRDQTQPPCTGNTESYPLDHQGSPCSWHLCVWEQVSIFLLIWILGWLYWNIYILKYFIKNYFFPLLYYIRHYLFKKIVIYFIYLFFAASGLCCHAGFL